MPIPTDLRLLEATCDDDLERLRFMLRPEEIWRSLAYRGWPDPDEWRTAFHAGERAGFFIVHERGGTIGFLVNGLLHFRDWGYVEFVVAITDPAFRRRGYGWQTLGLGMELWFSRGANVCWCYYSQHNPGAVGMARRIRSLDMAGGPRLLHTVNGPEVAGAGAFTRAQWELTKRDIGWT